MGAAGNYIGAGGVYSGGAGYYSTAPRFYKAPHFSWFFHDCPSSALLLPLPAVKIGKTGYCKIL